MTLSVYGSLEPVGARIVLGAVYGLLIWSATAALLVAGLSGLLTEEDRPETSTRQFALRSATCIGLLWWVTRPLLPEVLFGNVYWPTQNSGVGVGAVFVAALWGAAAFAITGVAQERRLRALAGAGAGAAAMLLSFIAHRALFAVHALALTGSGWGAALSWLLPVALIGSLAVVLYLTLTEGTLWRRFAWACALLVCWAIPVHLLDDTMRTRWDFGLPSLAAAADVPKAINAPEVGVVILSKSDGDPGHRYRQRSLAAGGVEVTPESLRLLRNYVDSRGMRTVFLAEALEALRQGWALNWDVDRAADADLLSRGQAFPPDYIGFLDAMTVAPATVDNYERLETAGPTAWDAKIPSIKKAQKVFEGFSTAYARFGDREKSDAWLRRIQGLWPLYEDNFHVEPIAEVSNGVISGELRFSGAAARGVKIGLFARPSTTTVMLANRHLVDAMFPDERGRFIFTDLLPGEYYLALQADPLVLGGDELAFANAPGLIKLEYGRMSNDLFPMRLYRDKKNAKSNL
jgi:hypothetical protein